MGRARAKRTRPESHQEGRRRPSTTRSAEVYHRLPAEERRRPCPLERRRANRHPRPEPPLMPCAETCGAPTMTFPAFSVFIMGLVVLVGSSVLLTSSSRVLGCGLGHLFRGLGFVLRRSGGLVQERPGRGLAHGRGSRHRGGDPAPRRGQPGHGPRGLRGVLRPGDRGRADELRPRPLPGGPRPPPALPRRTRHAGRLRAPDPRPGGSRRPAWQGKASQEGLVRGLRGLRPPAPGRIGRPALSGAPQAREGRQADEGRHARVPATS